MQQNSQQKELVRAAIRAYNERDREMFERLHAPDVVLHGRTEDVVGRAAVIDQQWAFLEAFPDSTITIDALVAEPGLVSVRYRTTATHEGPFQGIEPTGRDVEMGLQAMLAIKEGEITEKWVQADVHGLLAQLRDDAA
jgi:predicted ester cyclase